MADVKYFADLDPIAIVPDNRIFALENDPIGTNGYKVTTLQVKDYVNNGKLGGKIIYGGTIDSQNLDLDSTQGTIKGDVRIADGTTLSSLTTNYEFLVTSDNDFVNKKYVDDHSSNAIWTLIGTEVTLTTPTNTIGDTNPLSYTTHPTFTGTTEIVDKKYVDDKLTVLGYQEQLTVTFDGQTSFTLSQPIVPGSVAFAHVRGQFYERDFGFTATGTTFTWLDPAGFTLKTTDRLVVTYNYNLGAANFIQYWNRSGTNLFPLNTGDTLQVDDAGGFQIGVGGQNIDFIDTDITLAADSDSRIATQKATKAYVDNHSTNAIWSLDGTEVTLTTPTNTIGDTVPLKYTNHPSFTLDTQIVDKKYVDDQSSSVVAKQEVLPVTTPGQTAFTLAQTPSGTDSFGIFLNGVKQPTNAYSFAGTSLTWGNDPVLATDDLFEAWYDWQAPSIGNTNQAKIVYVGKAGSDSNDGLSIENPKLTIDSAIDYVALQSPSSTNPWSIYVIGGGEYVGGSTIKTIPPYTHLFAPEASIKRYSLDDNSICTFGNTILEESEVQFFVSTNNICTINGNSVRATGNNAVFISATVGVTVNVNIENIDMSTPGSSSYELTNGAKVIFNTKDHQIGPASSKSGTSSITFINVEDSVSSTFDYLFFTDRGRHISDAKLGHVFKKDNDDVINTESGAVSFPGNVAFKAGLSIPIIDVTGALEYYTILFDDTSSTGNFDQNNNYNPATGRVTFPQGGYGVFTANIFFTAVSGTLTVMGMKFIRRNSSGVLIEENFTFFGNPSNLRESSGQLFISGTASFKLDAGDTVEIAVMMGNDGVKNVDIQTSSKFTGFLWSA